MNAFLPGTEVDSKHCNARTRREFVRFGSSMSVRFASCTLAWPGRFGEVWLDWRCAGRFERLVDG